MCIHVNVFVLYIYVQTCECFQSVWEHFLQEEVLELTIEKDRNLDFKTDMLCICVHFYEMCAFMCTFLYVYLFMICVHFYAIYVF